MADDAQPKPRFEPPPWEREAFERFRAERQGQQPELEKSLAPAPEPQLQPDRTPEPAAEARVAAQPAPPVENPGGKQASLSDAHVETMLIGLRAEEPPAARANSAIVNTIIGLFVGAGVLLIIQAAILFGRTRVTGPGGILGATASLLIMLTGMGFMAGAILLFRKYRR